MFYINYITINKIFLYYRVYIICLRTNIKYSNLQIFNFDRQYWLYYLYNCWIYQIIITNKDFYNLAITNALH